MAELPAGRLTDAAGRTMRRSKYDFRSYAVGDWRMYQAPRFPRGNVRSAASKYGRDHGMTFKTFHVALIQHTVVKRTA